MIALIGSGDWRRDWFAGRSAHHQMLAAVRTGGHAPLRRWRRRRAGRPLRLNGARVILFGPIMEGLDPVAAKMNDPGPVLAGDAGCGGEGRGGDAEQKKQRKTTHSRKDSATRPGETIANANIRFLRSLRAGERQNCRISWQEWRGSNPQPPVLETGALPVELHSCSPRARRGTRLQCRNRAPGARGAKQARQVLSKVRAGNGPSAIRNCPLTEP